WLMDMFYKFISYNRRVIMPSKHADPALEPSFNRPYRLLYITFSLVLTAFILNSYSSHLGFLPETNMTRELAICIGQIFWQMGILMFINKSKAWDYTGNLITISLAGGIALALIQGLLAWAVPVNDLVYGGLFMLVVALMLAEHIRRTSILGLGWILSVSWVAYRIIILLIIKNL
ncbi:MAG TPA: hypothetical protein VGD26_02060, partial [Chitinophagaceae bacterium]